VLPAWYNSYETREAFILSSLRTSSRTSCTRGSGRGGGHARRACVYASAAPGRLSSRPHTTGSIDEAIGLNDSFATASSKETEYAGPHLIVTKVFEALIGKQGGFLAPVVEARIATGIYETSSRSSISSLPWTRISL
jgi:hypothetical protein